MVRRLVIATTRARFRIQTACEKLEGGALRDQPDLLEEVTWDDRKVTSIDWRTYKPLYLNAEVPVIETV